MASDRVAGLKLRIAQRRIADEVRVRRRFNGILFVVIDAEGVGETNEHDDAERRQTTDPQLTFANQVRAFEDAFEYFP